MRRARHPLAVAILLAGCSAAVPARYAGTLTRTSGTCASSTATLVLRGPAASFAPTDGVIVLPGTVSETGHLHALLITQGVNGKPYNMEAEGTVTPSTFTGHFRTPECRAEVALVAK